MNPMQTLNQEMDIDLSPDPLEDFVRLPGLLRRWEIQQVVRPGAEYRIEEAGEMDDGTAVFAIFHRDHVRPEPTDIGLPVVVTFEPGLPAVKARLLPISSGDEPLMAIMVVASRPGDAQVLARVRDLLAGTGASPAPEAPTAPAVPPAISGTPGPGPREVRP